jgi:hypothetical protein
MSANSTEDLRIHNNRREVHGAFVLVAENQPITEELIFLRTMANKTIK